LKQRLALPAAAKKVSSFAVGADLGDVAAHRLPATYLAYVFFGHPAAKPVAAVPLEPAARIVGMDPALTAPDLNELPGGRPAFNG
jgi:hypothetical protein